MRITSLFVTLLFTLPAASAVPTIVCALDPGPPCVEIDLDSAAGDGDCDDANGPGAVSHTVRFWTGANPAGNSSGQVQNHCNSPYGAPYADDWVNVRVTFSTPLSPYADWIAFFWLENSQGACYAAVYTSGRGPAPNVYQDLGPVLCAAGGPPTLPALP